MYINLNIINLNIFEKMQDILVYLFPFADIELKESLLLVNKELSKLRFKDFINDDVSQHILYNKGYLNIELYNKIQDNIKFIQRYHKDFSIDNKQLTLCKLGLKNIDLTGLINLQYLDLSNNQLQNIDLNGLINLERLSISNNQLQTIDLNGLINLEILYLYNNQLQNIDLTGLINLKTLSLFRNYLEDINLTGLINLQYVNIESNP